MTVNKERIQLLVDALRSGEYQQGFQMLFPAPGYACAWGVAVSVSEVDLYRYRSAFAVGYWYGLDDKAVAWIMSLNDHRRFTFYEIADRLYTRYLKDPE